MFLLTLMFRFSSRNSAILMGTRYSPLSGANADLLELGFNYLDALYSCDFVYAHPAAPEFRCTRSHPYTAANAQIRNNQQLQVPIWHPLHPCFYTKSSIMVIIKAGTQPCSGPRDMTHTLSLRLIPRGFNAELSFFMSPS